MPLPCSPSNLLAPSTVSRTSFTPAETADRPMKERFVAPAISLAIVVLPVPGGPQRIAELKRSASISARRGRPAAVPGRPRRPETAGACGPPAGHLRPGAAPLQLGKGLAAQPSARVLARHCRIPAGPGRRRTRCPRASGRRAPTRDGQGRPTRTRTHLAHPVRSCVTIASQDVEVVVRKDLPHVDPEASPVEGLYLQGGQEAAAVPVPLDLYEAAHLTCRKRRRIGAVTAMDARRPCRGSQNR